MTDFPTLLYTSTSVIFTLYYTVLERLKKVPLSGGVVIGSTPGAGKIGTHYFKK